MVTAEVLDVRGEICPYPLFQARQKLAALASGSRLEVLIDYPLALDNITRWAEGAGHTVLAVEEIGASEWRILIERT